MAYDYTKGEAGEFRAYADTLTTFVYADGSRGYLISHGKPSMKVDSETGLPVEADHRWDSYGLKSTSTSAPASTSYFVYLTSDVAALAEKTEGTWNTVGQYVVYFLASAVLGRPLGSLGVVGAYFLEGKRTQEWWEDLKRYTKKVSAKTALSVGIGYTTGKESGVEKKSGGLLDPSIMYAPKGSLGYRTGKESGVEKKEGGESLTKTSSSSSSSSDSESSSSKGGLLLIALGLAAALFGG